MFLSLLSLVCTVHTFTQQGQLVPIFGDLICCPFFLMIWLGLLAIPESEIDIEILIE